MTCTRSCPSRADGVVRVAPGSGRTFAMCRRHRPSPPVGPFGLSGQPPVSDQGHPAHRLEARARTRADHRAGAATGTRKGDGTDTRDGTRAGAGGAAGPGSALRYVGRPRRAELARTRTTTTSGRRRRTARGVVERPEPTLQPEPPAIDLPRLEAAGRTARAALASLAAHDGRPPRGRARR